MRKITTQLPDGTAVITLRPGIKKPDDANDALFSAHRQIQGGRIFVTGPGSIPSALWAARSGAAVVVWTDNINYAACIEDTFTSANLPQPVLHLQAGFENIDTDTCDCALVHLPRGKTLQMEVIQLAAAVLHKGGRLVFVGAKNEGVKGALKYTRELFQQAGIVTQKGGYHVGFAQKPPGEFHLPQLVYSQNEVLINSETATLINCPGVFAPGRLDGGAKALIESMSITVGALVLDMGCGTGLVGLSAIRMGAQVILTDVSARAVESTRRTLLANRLDAAVIHSSGAEQCKSGIFETVFTNPPFHKGHGVDYETTRYLLDEAARVLIRGGNLYLVANSFLKYGPWIENIFSNAAVIYGNQQFRVWQATKI